MVADTQTDTQSMNSTAFPGWQGGVVGGLVGGIAMGAMIWMNKQATLEMAIPALYTLEGAVAGWIVHLFHSLVLGLVFVALVRLPALREYSESLLPSAGLGLVYGAVLWVVAAGVVMPAWLQAVGFAGAPMLPNWALPGSLVPHLVYGVLLGVVYAFLER